MPSIPEEPDESNKPRVFLKRQIDKYIELSNETEDGDPEAHISAATISAVLLLNNQFSGISSYIPDPEIKNNSVYMVYQEKDELDASSINERLRHLIHIIHDSPLERGSLRAFFLVSVVNEKHPIPITINSRVYEKEKGDILCATIYKDNPRRFIEIPMNDIQEIKAVSLVTLRGFQRGYKQKVNCVKHLEETATEFNTNML